MNLKNIIFYLLFLLPAALVISDNYSVAMSQFESHWPATLTAGDQHGIYVELQDILSGHISNGIKTGWLSTGYMSTMGFFHKLSGFWREPNVDYTFSFHGLFYLSLAVLVLVLFMYRVAWHQSPSTNRFKIILGCDLFFIAIYKLSILFKFVGYLPWSHYSAAFLGISFIWLTYEFIHEQKKLYLFGFVFFGYLFFLTRRHEAVASFVAVFLTVCFYLVCLKKDQIVTLLKSSLRYGVYFFVGVLLSYGFVKYFSNNMPINSHYEQQRSSNSYVNEYLKIYPEMIPLRIVQTFFDPNFYSYGNEYELKSVVDHSFNFLSFKMPMIYQLPILLYVFPMSLFSLCFLLYKKRFIRKPEPAQIALLLGFFTFAILACGYLSAAAWGTIHLQSGLVREFLFSCLVLFAATGPGLGFLIYNEKADWRRWGVPLLGIVLLPLLLGQVLLLHVFSTEIHSKHIKTITENHNCVDGQCSAELKYFLENGNEILAPFNKNIINFHCSKGSDGNYFSAGESGVTELGPKMSFDIKKCSVPVSVEIYPIFIGYVGSANSQLKFETCPSQKLSPECKLTP